MSSGLSSNNLDWDVEFTFSDPPQTLHLIVEQDLLLGRTPNGKDTMPSVDLSLYNGTELGVSRRHGILSNTGDGVIYSDLGGENGSILNGRRLDARESVKLKTGDVLLLGHFKAVLTLKSHTRKTSIMAVRPDLTFGGGTVKGRGQRILVVDDEVGLTDMYRIALERGGYTVHTAREMVSAIRALNHLTPQAIVLDVMLPGIHGLELCRYVRRDTQVPDIPVIVTSALTTSEAVKNAMDAGADVFLAKPVDWRELIRVVGTMVQHSETTNPAIHTKKLAGTARLDFIPAATRPDTVVMFLDTHREPLTAVVQPQITLGRQNPGGTVAVRDHIDLDPYSALDKGVSRLHATIRRVGNEFEIEDMGSANGTYINGYSIAPQKGYPLKNGAEVRLGDLRMHIYFLSETEVGEPFDPKNF